MTFNDNAQLDTSQVSGGMGGGGLRGGGIMIGGGGGVLGLIVLLVYMFMGGGQDTPVPSPGRANNPFDSTQVAGAGRSSDTRLFDQCKTGADANRDVNCRIVGTVNSVQAFWATELAQNERTYRKMKTVLYSGVTQSRCGTASNQVGPFYCPLDRQIYIDATFFDTLSEQFGASNGALAQMYVVAHEYGHAVQDQLGLLNAAQQDPKGPESGGVRTELMADCFAGMWAQHASTTKDAAGTTLIKPLTEDQIRDALSAASAVGDDRIMKRTTGRVRPENFTHGTSEQRQRWFLTGYQATSINQCNTLRTSQL